MIKIIKITIFQRDALSQLLFLLAMIPLNPLLAKCTGGNKLSKSQKKINHLIYKGDIKLLTKIKMTGNPNTGSENTELGYRDGILHRKKYYTIMRNR